MSWNVHWSRVAIDGLIGIPWPAAARLDAAVMRFAESTEGDVEQIGGNPHHLRLCSGTYVARLRLEPEGRRIVVMYVTRR